MIDFSKAIPDERGCGTREPGGVYLECGLSPFGLPLEHFLFDPPLPLPEGIDLINKPQLWSRVDPATSEPMIDEETEQPIYDVLIHIGAEHYPYAPDYIEETRRLGASRRLNANLDLSKLTRRSRMLLAHPKGLIASWRDTFLPRQCKRKLPYHDQAWYALLYRELLAPGDQLDATRDSERAGPCIFKLWEVLPQNEAIEIYEQEEDYPLCLRRTGSTIYEYQPTGEEITSWEQGFILGLPITNIALIQYEDGSVNKKAREKLLLGNEKNGSMALPFYETDC